MAKSTAGSDVLHVFPYAPVRRRAVLFYCRNLRPFLFLFLLFSIPFHSSSVRPLVDLFFRKGNRCPNLANAGILPRVSRQNLPLHLSSVFCRISFVRLFPPPSEGSKINPSGRKQAE